MRASSSVPRLSSRTCLLQLPPSLPSISPRGHSSRTIGRTQSICSSSSPTSSSSTLFQPSASAAALQQWVLEAGGYMHEALLVVDEAPCGGGRGVVCTRDLQEDEVTGMPMLLVPEDSLMTSEVARHGFSSHYEPRGAAPLGELDQCTQLAILLAHERLDGDASYYHPYIASLPARPPCAWALDPASLQRRLASLSPRLGPEGLEAWAEEVRRYRQAMERHAEGAEQRYKSHFPLTADSFFWSMGHVLSRSFALSPPGASPSSPPSLPGLALIPLIDLCNHRAGTDHPELVALGGDESDRCMCVSSVSAQGAWRRVTAGEELCIRYSDAAEPSSSGSRSSSSGSSSGSSGSHLSSGGGGGSHNQGTAGAPGQLVLPAPGVVAASGPVQLQVPQPDALLCFLSHGHVFPELWK